MDEKESRVILTKPQAAALQSALAERVTAENVLTVHAKYPNGWTAVRAPLNGLPLRTVAFALYVGYDVEETPEERIKAKYKREEIAVMWACAGADGNAISYSNGYRDGIQFTLDALGVKIRDVNAPEEVSE